MSTQNNSKAGRRTFWLITVLFLMILGAVAVSSYYFIREASVVMVRDLEHQLGSKAQNKTASITVWFGGLKNSVHMFADTDMFRLFTAEAHRLHGVEGHEETTIKEGHAPDLERDHKQLQSSRPLMNKQLRNFARTMGLLGARVLEHNLDVLLTTDSTLPKLEAIQINAVKKVLETGTLVALPVEANSDGLVMDLVQPVFPPAYMEMPPNVPVAVLILHVPVTAPLTSFLESNNAGQSMRILQHPAKGEGDLQELLPASGSIAEQQGWQTPEDKVLPLQRRPLADGTQVYSLGVSVPDLPWIVTEEEKAYVAEAAYIRARNTVLLSAGASVATAGLLLCFVWWLIVGRSERAFAEELKRLYQAVNDQKQLLDGINTALADGMVMTDPQGRIKYTNSAFAHMVGHSPNALFGLEYSSLLPPESAQRIAANRAHVLSTGKGRIFNDAILLRGRRRHFQIACSPYKDEEGKVTGTVAVYRDTTQMVEAQENSQRMVRQTINVLMRAIEAVDPYLCGHSAHTGYLASALAQKIGLSTADRDTVRTAATLSQIGMLRLPPELLRKSGTLTLEERKLMEKHVEYACMLLAGFDFGLPVQATISQMHECLDGSGYPAGIRGEQIGMHARILAISNAFCAMIRPRSYRQGKDVQEVLVILSVQPPKYDPSIIHILGEFLQSEKGRNFLMELRGGNRQPAQASQGIPRERA